MSNETLSDLRLYVSNCFNHRGYCISDGHTLDDSAYMRLSKLMLEEYDLTHNDVDEVVGDIEQMVAKYIKEYSPNFDDDE
jgi:hypothetical protein